MIVGVPTSSITILEETERHVNGIPILTNDSSIDPTPASLCTIISPSESYPLVASELADAKLEHQSVINPKELPFELLAGEECSKYEHDSSDGIIYLTNFRLFVFTTESTCSFINCPLRLIDSIEIKDNIYLYIQCKDLRSFRLVFLTGEKCCFWSRKLLDVISTPTSFDDLFAFKFASSIPNHEYNNRDYLHEEFSRLQLDNDPWRLTDINQKYKICPTYPEINVVPSSITDSELGDVAKFRSYRRFPSVVWKHNNGAVIVRTSQPEVGWLFWRSKEDEKMIQSIIEACSTPTNKPIVHEKETSRLVILDARSYTAAVANRAKGGGFEYPPYYPDCEVQFMNLPNIHAIRKSAQMLRVAIANAAQGENWLSQLESTRWLHNLSLLIGAACFVVGNIDQNARPVLVHCSDGWDRTPQITSLAEIMLDPYYRTMEGFQILIKREWLAFGHKFADRCGHGIGANDVNERSPVFLQWLDCIYQLFVQNPIAFEFNEMFLLKLASHTYTCLHGTFLYNNDFERTTEDLDHRTLSIWSLLNIKSTQFINHLFDETKKEILYPSHSVRDLRIWSNLYLREHRSSSAGTIEHPSSSASLVPGGLHSFEDLSNPLLANLPRSNSDPSLTGSISLESSSATLRTSTHASLTPQSNRLQNSTSTNSLFGQPHHLGTLNGSNQNMTTNSINGLSTPTSPNSKNVASPSPNPVVDSPRKRESFTTDDSTPDLTQLALSMQRFPMNADGIIRMSRPRKHTNSTSSTGSGISDTWSLTRTNSQDANHHQRAQQTSTSDKALKSVRKRIDVDGLTKIPDQITSRMLDKERIYIEQIEKLHGHLRRTQKLIHTLIKFNHNNNANNVRKQTEKKSIKMFYFFVCSKIECLASNGRNLAE